MQTPEPEVATTPPSPKPHIWNEMPEARTRPESGSPFAIILVRGYLFTGRGWPQERRDGKKEDEDAEKGQEAGKDKDSDYVYPEHDAYRPIQKLQILRVECGFPPR